MEIHLDKIITGVHVKKTNKKEEWKDKWKEIWIQVMNENCYNNSATRAWIKKNMKDYMNNNMKDEEIRSLWIRFKNNKKEIYDKQEEEINKEETYKLRKNEIFKKFGEFKYNYEKNDKKKYMELYLWIIENEIFITGNKDIRKQYNGLHNIINNIKIIKTK